jgi:hypothetical protein
LDNFFCTESTDTMICRQWGLRHCCTNNRREEE